MVHDDVELEAARPNDRLRAAALEALDLADRAGVRLSAVHVSQYGQQAPTVGVHASSGDGPMAHADALRILLRVAALEAHETSAVREGGGRLVVHHTARTSSGVELHLYAQPSPEQLEAHAAARAELAAVTS